MSKSDTMQASSNLNYQDDVNAGFNCEHDLNVTAPSNEVDDEDVTDHIKSAVQKVSICLNYYSMTVIVTDSCAITISASKNCLFSALNSPTSRKLDQTDPNHKFTEWHIATNSNPHS